MLNINNKMYLNKRFVVIDAEFNIMVEIILAHILAHTYAIADTHIEDIEFDDVLFISNNSTSNTTYLESQDFKEAGVTMQRNNFPKRVRTCSAYEFNDVTESLNKYKEGTNLVILGFVNTIPEHIFRNIMEFFGRDVNFALFGDPIIDAPEHNSYFMRYLTNASIGVKLEYDTYRRSDKKKINNTLSKLRKDVSNLTDITHSNNVSLVGTDTIKIGSIAEYISEVSEDGPSVTIVPKRLFSRVSSMLFQYMFYRSSLDFQVGDQYYTKYHWTFLKDDKQYVVPPLTKVTIMRIANQMFVQKHRCFVCDISIDYPDNPMIVMNVVVDFTDYLFNFDNSQHPENLEDFEDIVQNINVFNQHIYDAAVLKIMFAPILTSDMPKYYQPIGRTMSFIETLERDTYYSTDFNWYKHFCTTLNQIDVVFNDTFEDIIP